MSTIVASEAVLKVRLELPKDMPGVPGASNVPGVPGGSAPAPSTPNEPPPIERDKEDRRPPNRGGDGPESGSDDGGDMPFNPLDHVKRIGQSAYSGGLYAQALATAAASVSFIPGAAAAVNAAEMVRKYGPAAAEAIRAGIRGATAPGLVRDTAEAAADEAVKIASSVSEGLSDVRAQLESISETVDAVKTAAGAQLALSGEIGDDELAAFGTAYRQVRAFQIKQASDRDQLVIRRVGKGVGELFAGAAGR